MIATRSQATSPVALVGLAVACAVPVVALSGLLAIVALCAVTAAMLARMSRRGALA